MEHGNRLRKYRNEESSFFWDSKEDFNKKMEKYYKEISKKALETAYGDGKKKR